MRTDHGPGPRGKHKVNISSDSDCIDNDYCTRTSLSLFLASEYLNIQLKYWVLSVSTRRSPQLARLNHDERRRKNEQLQ